MNKIIFTKKLQYKERLLILEDFDSIINLHKEYFDHINKNNNIYILYTIMETAEQAIKHIEDVGYDFYTRIYVDYHLKDYIDGMTGGDFIKKIGDKLDGYIYACSSDDNMNLEMQKLGADEIISKDNIYKHFDKEFIDDNK